MIFAHRRRDCPQNVPTLLLTQSSRYRSHILKGIGTILEPVSKPVCRAFKRVAAGWSFSTTV